MGNSRTALEALARFRKRAEEGTTKSTGSMTTSSPSMSVESPSMSNRSYNTPSTGHMGLFKGTGFANTSRIKTSETDFPWSSVTVPAGLAAGAGIGGLVKTRGNPAKLVDLVRRAKIEDEAARELLAPLLIGGGLGGVGGGTLGSYLENKMSKKGAISKFAEEVKDPSLAKTVGTSAAVGAGLSTVIPFVGMEKQLYDLRREFYNYALRNNQETINRLKSQLADKANHAFHESTLRDLLRDAERRLRETMADKPTLLNTMGNTLKRPDTWKMLGVLGGIGALTGAGVGYLGHRIGRGTDKEGALSKYALGIQQPNMITKSLRSAAGREGGYTAGNLSKGSGAYKPTRETSTFSEGKSSAMDKM